MYPISQLNHVRSGFGTITSDAWALNIFLVLYFAQPVYTAVIDIASLIYLALSKNFSRTLPVISIFQSKLVLI